MIEVLPSGTLNPELIESHFNLCSKEFKSQVAEQINVSLYAEKISKRADLVCGWDRQELVGLVAYYKDPAHSRVFITNFSVAQIWQGKGLGRKLMQSFLSEIGSLNEIQLRVSDRNTRAIKFYEKHDFRVIRDNLDKMQTGSILMARINV